MTELSMLVKVTVVLILGLAGARLGSRQSAAMRSLILASAFGLLLALPIAALMLPERAIEVPAAYAVPLVGEPVAAVAPVAGSPVAADSAAASQRSFRMPSMRTSLLTLWAAGAFAFMAPLVVGLWRLRRLRTQGRPWPHVSRPSSVDVLLHDKVRVPVTFGIRRPVIALPDDAPQWAGPDLRRVLLHELEHVRRRDWPVHMTARAICALYWFHPLVWIAWHQLCLESERACDDAVLRAEDGTAYAAQLVALARRISRQDPLPLLSIAGRSNLSTRVSAMLARNVERGRVRIATVVVLAAVAVVAALGIGPLVAVVPQQRPAAESPTSRLAFASASIRRHDPATRKREYCCQVQYGADGRVTGSNVDLVDLIVSAYGLYRWQVEDAPTWADARIVAGETGHFDVQATAQPGASEDDMRQMLRTMLADRFRLAVHRESRTQKVYELVVEPGGHKLQPPGGRKLSGDDVWLRVDPENMIATLDVEQMTMAQLAQNLGFPMGTLILDRTGLAGAYRVTARWNAFRGSRQPNPVGAGARDLLQDGGEIFEAFPAQLGLRFRDATASVEYLVVDRAERPTLD